MVTYIDINIIIEQSIPYILNVKLIWNSHSCNNICVYKNNVILFIII